MIIGHVDSLVQSRTSKHIWLPLATKIVAWNFYLLLKFGQDCFAEVFIFLFSYCSTYHMNVYHAIPDDIKRFQQVELQHYIIQTGNLKFSSGNYTSPDGHKKATWWFF